MKIAFITDVISENMTGVGVYSRALIQSIMDSFPDFEYFFIDHKPHKKELFKYKKKPQIILIKKNNSFFSKKSFWLNYIALKLRNYDFDFIFNLDGAPHYLPFKQKEIFVLHDLSYLENFDYSPVLRQVNNQMFLYRSLTQSYKVITNSNKTKKEAMIAFRIKDNKIIAINDLPFLSVIKTKKYSTIKKPFFLCIGNLEKRKNILNLLDAFAILKEEYKIKQKLIIVGKSAFGGKEILKSYINNKYKKDIQITNYVNEQKKVFLFKNADLFIYPSFYEGLGIPLLEAANLKCPIVASNVPAGVEILKKNYFMMKYNDKNTVVATILKALRNTRIKQDLVNKSYQKAINYFNDQKYHQEMKRLFNFLIK